MRRRISVAVIGGMTLAIGIAALVLRASAWTSYRDARFGSEIAYPADWHIHVFNEDARRFPFRGVLVSNVEFRPRHPELPPGSWTSAWDTSELPRNGVLIEFSHLTTFSICEPGRPDTPFPLRLSKARVLEPRGAHREEQLPRLWLRIPWVDGDPSYQVNVWFGDGVSREL